jgi:hypothetical protein
MNTKKAAIDTDLPVSIAAFSFNLCSILLKELDFSRVIRKVYLNLCPKIGNNYPFA